MGVFEKMSGASIYLASLLAPGVQGHATVNFHDEFKIFNLPYAMVCPGRHVFYCQASRCAGPGCPATSAVPPSTLDHWRDFDCDSISTSSQGIWDDYNCVTDREIKFALEAPYGTHQAWPMNETFDFTGGGQGYDNIQNPVSGPPFCTARGFNRDKQPDWTLCLSGSTESGDCVGGWNDTLWKPQKNRRCPYGYVLNFWSTSCPNMDAPCCPLKETAQDENNDLDPNAWCGPVPGEYVADKISPYGCKCDNPGECSTPCPDSCVAQEEIPGSEYQITWTEGELYNRTTLLAISHQGYYANWYCPYNCHTVPKKNGQGMVCNDETEQDEWPCFQQFPIQFANYTIPTTGEPDENNKWLEWLCVNAMDYATNEVKEECSYWSSLTARYKNIPTIQTGVIWDVIVAPPAEDCGNGCTLGWKWSAGTPKEGSIFTTCVDFRVVASSDSVLNAEERLRIQRNGELLLHSDPPSKDHERMPPIPQWHPKSKADVENLLRKMREHAHDQDSLLQAEAKILEQYKDLMQADEKDSDKPHGSLRPAKAHTTAHDH